MTWARTFNVAQVLLAVAVILAAEFVHHRLGAHLVVGLAVTILVAGVGRELWDLRGERRALSELERETGSWMLVTGPRG